MVVLLDSVPGTLFLKTLDSDRHLAIPVDFVEIVPGTDGYSLIVLGHDVHVGHLTALSYHGYEHSLKLGVAQSIRLYSAQSLPSWVAKVEIGPGFIKMKRNPFSNGSVGLVDVPFGTWDWPIPYSSAERAFIELASTLETREDILQAKLMFEGAANLRPMLLQSLLETCSNIQTKRLFLWLARTIGHPWYKHIDISRINLGAGKRQIVSGGTLDTQFLITVPKEVQDGQRLTISDQPRGFIGYSPRIIPGRFIPNSDPNSSLALRHKNTHLAIPVDLLESEPGTDGYSQCTYKAFTMDM